MVVDPDVACSIMSELGKTEPGDNFSDFTVVVEDQEFRCHRFMLNATSQFFNALLRSDMKEAIANKAVLRGISKKTFSDILDCLYKGKQVLTDQNVYQMWYAASLLQIKFLFEHCEKFVIEHLIPKRLDEPYYHANNLESSHVLSAIVDVIAKEFDMYSACSLFLHLNPKDVVTVVKHRDLKVTNEDDVVCAVLEWVSHECGDDDDSNTSTEDCDESEKEEANVEDGPIKKLTVSATHIVRPGCNKNLDFSSFLASEECWTPQPCPSHYISRTQRKTCLGQLLGACRLALVSHDCIDRLLGTDDVLESKEAMAIVRQAVMYHLRPWSDHWPDWALHRSASSFDNVVVFADQLWLMAFSFQRNTSYIVSNLPTTVDDRPVSISVINNQIFYLMQSLKTGSPTPECSELYAHQAPCEWTHVLQNVLLRHTFVQLGTFIYLAIDFHVKKFSAGSMLGHDASVEIVCTLPFYSSKVQSMAAVGKNILFFCNVSRLQPCNVLCLNTETKLLKRLPALGSVEGQIVSFKDDQATTYLLSENGSLLKVVENSDDPRKKPRIQFMTKLWGFTWEVTGAVVYRKELFLFGKPNQKLDGISLPYYQAFCPDDDAAKKLWPWSISLPGLFEQIKIVIVDSRSGCLPVVIPEKWMTEKSLESRDETNSKPS